MGKRNPALEARLRRCFARPGTGWRRAGDGAIFAYDQCDSTMERAHALVREGIGEGALVFARMQTQGRGRLGRAWESPEGGVYFSLILKPARPTAEAPQLSLVAGLAVAEGIEELLGRVLPLRRGLRAQTVPPRACPVGGTNCARRPGSAAPVPTPVVSIRWPNDILIDGKKVAGILVEAKNGAVVIGIGINVTTDAKALPDTATSVAEKVSDTFSRKSVRHFLALDLTAAVCRKFDGWYDVWTAQGFAPIRQALRPWMSHMGGIVRLTAGSSQVEGQAADLDESGRLVVRLDSGVVRAFDAGEVTLLR